MQLHILLLSIFVKISAPTSQNLWFWWAQEVGYWDRFQAKALRGYGPGSLFIWDSRTVHQNCPPSDPTLWR